MSTFEWDAEEPEWPMGGAWARQRPASSSGDGVAGASGSGDADCLGLDALEFQRELSKQLWLADQSQITGNTSEDAAAVVQGLDSRVASAAGPSNSPFTASSAEEGSDEFGKPEDWDIARGPRKEGKFGQLKMVLPAVTKIALSTMTGLVATGGYVMGKVGESTGITGKAVDTMPFQAGFISWLWTNGVFPSLQYEPVGDAGRALAEYHGISEIPERDIRQTAVIVSNHICYLDGIVLAALFRAPKIIAKADTRHTPVLGKLMEEMDVIFVERGDSNSRQMTLDAISSHCSSWKPGCRPLLIFPEGTTTNGEGLVEFRKGAFVAGMPVRPVIIVYTGQWNPATTNYVQAAEGNEPEAFSDAEWGMQFLGHFIHSMHVRVLPPYVPSVEEQSDPGLYARNCREYMLLQQNRVRSELQTNYLVDTAGSLLKDVAGYIDAAKTMWAKPIVSSSGPDADITLSVTATSFDDQPKLISDVHSQIINPLVQQQHVIEFHVTTDPPSAFDATPGSHLFLKLTVPCPWPYTMRDLNRWARAIGQDTKIQVVQ